MSRATEVYAREFDSVFINLPLRVRASIEAKIQDLGLRLSEYPHQRLKGRSEFRLRVGDYRIIYEFDPKQRSFTCSQSAIAARYTAEQHHRGTSFMAASVG